MSYNAAAIAFQPGQARFRDVAARSPISDESGSGELPAASSAVPVGSHSQRAAYAPVPRRGQAAQSRTPPDPGWWLGNRPARRWRWRAGRHSTLADGSEARPAWSHGSDGDGGGGGTPNSPSAAWCCVYKPTRVPHSVCHY